MTHDERSTTRNLRGHVPLPPVRRRRSSAASSTTSTSILERAGAELVAIQKWDERRLAYDISSNKRGLYILTYFKSDRSRIPGIERDCNLSELMLRSMILRAEHVPAEEIEAANQREALDDEIKLREVQAAEDARRPRRPPPPPPPPSLLLRKRQPPPRPKHPPKHPPRHPPRQRLRRLKQRPKPKPHRPLTVKKRPDSGP